LYEGNRDRWSIDCPKQVHIAEVAMPTPEPGEVLIRSRAVGICGSDVELYQGTRPEGFYRYPLVPGHEWSGEVAALGERARGLSVVRHLPTGCATSL